MIEHYSPQNEAIRITQNYIEYASNNSETTTNDETHFYNGMDGSLVQAFAPTGLNSVHKYVQFDNPIRPDDTLILEFYIDGIWRDYSQLSMNRKSDSITSPTVFAGCDTWTTTNIRRLRVNFYSKVSETVTWASLASSSYRWRVKKISGSNFAESVEVNKSITVAGNYSISQGISTVNVNASTATIDLSSVLLNSKVLIRKISAYDGNAITINASGATFEGLASLELYDQYGYVELERISATVFAIKDLNVWDSGNAFRASSSFTLPAMPDGARKRILNTHETNAITVTAYSGTTIEGQTTMTLSAGHEVEIELIGTDWRKVVLSQSDTPEAGKAMVWPSESSPGTPFTMPTFLVKDMYRANVESGSGGLLTVLYDNVDNPSIMRIIPKFRVQDIHTDFGTGTHPAFIVDGVEKSEIFIGAFQASAGAGSRAVSVPGRTPWVNVNFDAARAACTGKGTGWHLMTNWEWAAVMLWCLKNGYQPRGNTDSGRAHDALWETISAGVPGKTGTGPASWRHDGTLGGISDLVGNVWEWQDGMKLVDGQVIMPNDNHFAQAESSWAAQGVYFDSTGSTGTDTNANENGAPVLSAARSVPSDDCGNGLGVNAPDFDYTHKAGESGWRTMAESASYDSLSAAIRQRMMQAAIAPKISSAAAVPFTGKGAIWCRNYGERVPIRGGCMSDTVRAGVATPALDERRSRVSNSIGFRPAFIG